MSLADGRVKAVPQMVFNRLSFTHIVELLHVNDDNRVNQDNDRYILQILCL